MNEKLLKNINHYGVNHQQRKLQEEVFELIEAIIEYRYVEVYKGSPAEKYHKEHIKEEIVDNCVMVYQFPLYYYEKLDVHNIAPYEFKTDNYEHIEDINKYIKNFTKTINKLNKAVIIAEEREQDFISEYYYEEIIYAVDEVLYKLKSIKEYYGISTKELEKIGEYKIDRQMERIENEEQRKLT